MCVKRTLMMVSLVALSIMVSAIGTQVYVDGIDAAFPPFSFIDENGNPAGFDVEVVQWIAQEMGVEVEIVPVDWDAIIPTLLSGNIDFVASGMTITQVRLEQVNFTDPYWQINLAVVVRETCGPDEEPVPEFNIFTAMQSGMRIGVQRGTTSQDWLEENVQAAGIDVRLVLYDNFLLALEDLLIGRIEAAVMDSPTAQSGIRDRPLTIVGTIETKEIYGYAVRKEDTDLLALLNEGLARIRATNTWDTLVDKWMVGN